MTVDGTPIKGNVLHLYIGQKVVYASGVKKDIDVVPEIKSGRTMLPARYILEGMGYKVDWDEKNQLVICTRGNRQIDLQAVLAKIQELKNPPPPPDEQAGKPVTYINDPIQFDSAGWPERKECFKYGYLALTKHMTIDKKAGTLTFDLPTAPKGSVWWIDVNYDMGGRTYYNQFRKQITNGKMPVTKGGRYVLNLPFSKMTRCYIEVGLAKENNTLDQTPNAVEFYDVLKNTYEDVIMGGTGW